MRNESVTVRSLLLIPSFLGVMAVASAQAPAVSPAADPTMGYPLWYQDATGVRLRPCLSGANGLADPFCVVLADPGFNPANPLAFPTNWPVEFFYTVADSDKLTTPGCPASGIAPGTAKWRGAVEGSFLTGVVQPGQQSTFTRTKIVASGLCPNTTYTFTHPYGTDLVTTNSAGQVVANKKGATIDIGCLAAPCDFSLALNSRVMGGFLKWDPAVAPAAPAGYLGDAATLHAITGSPAGTNVFSIAAAVGGPLASTTQFTVSGKIAGPLTASLGTLDFGGQTQGSTSVPGVITITNLYSLPITPSVASFTGLNNLDFGFAANTCSSVILARDQSCSISVTFRPSLIGIENATLELSHNGPFGSPLTVALTGVGTVPQAAPVVTLSATALAFADQRVATTSPVRTVTVFNTGNAPLGATVTVVNADPNLYTPAADQFVKTTDTCTGVFVAAGSSCIVSVEFAPTVATATASTALLRFADDAVNSPQDVILTGKGTGGLAAVSTAANPPGLNGFGFPNWYQDENALQVQPCLNPAEPCVLLADPGFNPANAIVLPGNFPIEFFYFVADSDKMDVPGCPASGFAGGKMTFRAALEGSFATGAAQDGQQITFARTKIVVSPGGLCPNKTYAFTHPYGTDLITTDAAGGVVANKKGATVDIGCAGPPCDWKLALGSRVMGGLLRWDPNILPLAPAGFLGDAAGAAGTPHAVVGSPYLDPVSGTPANFLRISDPDTGTVLTGCKDALGVTSTCRVDKFTVSGKLAGPVVVAPGSIDFGVQVVGVASPAKNVVLTNTDPLNPVTINNIAFVGPNSGEFKAQTDSCAGQSLAANGGNCSIGVSLTAVGSGLRIAALSVSHAGLNSPVQLPLSGVGNQAPVAANDSATVASGGSANINVLANDSDPDGNLPLTAGLASIPVNGVAVVQADNTITYTPNVGFVGTDVFTYQAVDSRGAVSNTAAVTVSVSASTASPTTVTISAPATTFNANAAVTVTVTSSAGTPAGNVSLLIDGTTALTQSLSNGATTFNIASPSVGSHSLQANYAAQGNFAAGSATGTLVVNGAVTTTSMSAPGITWPANGVVTVRVSSAVGTPAGNVSLTVDSGTPLQAALVSGSAVFTLTNPGAATHDLIASFAAQGDYAASSANGSLVVSGAATTTTVTAPAITWPNNGSVTVTVGSAAGTPVGNVSLIVDGGTPLQAALVSGSAVFSLTNPNAGNHTLSAIYAAQGNFAASGPTAGSLVVNGAATITAIVSAATVTFGTNATVIVGVSSFAGTPAGNATLTVDGGAVLTAPLSNGQATFVLVTPNAGNHALSATYSAQGNFAASGPATGTLLVNQAVSTTSVTAPSITWGTNGLITVTVAPAPGSAASTPPTGNVSLSVDGGTATVQPLAPIAGTTSSKTTFTIFTPSVGTHTLTATYAGLGNFAPSSNSTTTLTVNPLITETITATASANRAATTANWIVSGTTSALTPTHTMTVRLTRTNALIGSAQTDKQGKWTVSANKSPVVPIVGDTITVSSSGGIFKTFPVTVK